GAGGLVEEHQLGVHRECPGDGDALLLPAGELRGVVVGAVRQAHPLQQLARGRLRRGLRQAAHLDRGLHHVAERGEMREEVEALEDHADAGALGGDLLAGELLPAAVRQGVGPVPLHLAVDEDAPGAGLLELVDAAQQGGLAGAGGAHQHCHLAGVHREGAALQHVEVAEGLVDLLDLDDGTGRVLGGPCHHSSTSGSGSCGVVPALFTAAWRERPPRPPPRGGVRASKPRPKYRSRWRCPAMSTRVIGRYRSAATMSSGIGVNCLLAMPLVAKVRSRVKGTASTSEVVFSMPMVSFPSGGTITRMACGTMIRRRIVPLLMPSAFDASDCPRSTEFRPERMISAR